MPYLFAAKIQCVSCRSHPYLRIPHGTLRGVGEMSHRSHPLECEYGVVCYAAGVIARNQIFFCLLYIMISDRMHPISDWQCASSSATSVGISDLFSTPVQFCLLAAR